MSSSSIGPYRLLGELGRGGMGVVYRAIDELGDRPVAIKVPRPDLAEDLARDAEATAHLRTEALALAAIEHPGVVALYDHGRAPGGAPYVALELVEGETLAVRIGARGLLPVIEALALARRIAVPLAEVHARGVVHRDLKPDHVLLASGDELGGVKLFDFGLAKIDGLPPALPADGMVFGTPAYMAPEQCVGAEPCDHRADLYALGCVLFEMLSGTSPYGFLPARAILVAHVRGPVPDVAIHASVPPAVARLVARLLAKRPDDRPADALEVIAQLDGLIDGLRADLAGARPRRIARGTGAHAPHEDD